MTGPPVLFSDAIRKAVEMVFPRKDVLLVRDVHGRIRVALDKRREGNREEIESWRARVRELGPYAGPGEVICRDDLFDPEAVFGHGGIVTYTCPVTGRDARLLDRQVTGQDWSGTGAIQHGQVPRLVFYGLKGGVGRSTAMAIAAYSLARSGKRVLLIDLDLESPGLSSMVLPPEKFANFGVVDWLLEDAAGQGEFVLERMIADSPLGEDLGGAIRVVAAGGHGDASYLDKLARAYGDVPGPDGGPPVRFSRRLLRLVQQLEEREKPDAVLIDSRAGLHDLAALSITHLATTAFLFATDTAQSWDGYRSLFQHWVSRPGAARATRERLRMVTAMFPETDQVRRAESFLSRSYELFTSTLYDETGPDASGHFSFDLSDTEAPHYPVRIRWSAQFQEFQPLLLQRGIIGEDELRAAFGKLIDAAGESL